MMLQIVAGSLHDGWASRWAARAECISGARPRWSRGQSWVTRRRPRRRRRRRRPPAGPGRAAEAGTPAVEPL